MSLGMSTFEIEKYSHSSQFLQAEGGPVGEVAWQHHPARDNLFLVFDTRRDFLLKVVHGQDVLESLNISDVLSQRSQGSEPPLVVLVRSPSIAFKYNESGGGLRKIRRFQVRTVGDSGFQEALNILRNAGCPIKSIGQPNHPTSTSEAERPGSRPLSAATSITGGYGDDGSHHRNFRPFLGMSTANQEPAASFGYKPRQLQHQPVQNRGLNHSGGRAYSSIPQQNSTLRPVSAPMFYADDLSSRLQYQQPQQHHGQYSSHSGYQSHQPQHHYQPQNQHQYHHQRPPSVDSGVSELSSSQDYFNHQMSSSQSGHGEHNYMMPPASQSQHRRELSRELSLQPISSPTMTARPFSGQHAQIHPPTVCSDADMIMADDGDASGSSHNGLPNMLQDNLEPPPKRKSIDFEAAKKVGGDKPLPGKAPLSPIAEKEKDKESETGANTANSTTVVTAPARKRKAPAKKPKETPIDQTFKKAKSNAKGITAKPGTDTGTVSFVPSATDASPSSSQTPASSGKTASRPTTSEAPKAKKAQVKKKEQPSIKFDDLSVFFNDPADHDKMESKLVELLHNDDFVKLMERLEPLNSRIAIKQTRNLFTGEPTSEK